MIKRYLVILASLIAMYAIGFCQCKFNLSFVKGIASIVFGVSIGTLLQYWRDSE